MLEQILKDQLKEYLKLLKNSVEIYAVVNSTAESNQMLELLEDIASSSELISIKIKNSEVNERSPSFGLRNKEKEINLVFSGIPLGHEFSSLVLALLQVGGHPAKISNDDLEIIKNISEPLYFETYYSQSCQNCPDVVQALNLLAVLNPNIKHNAIDGAFFPDEVEKREIMAVPSVFLNGISWNQGRIGLEEILNKLSDKSSERKKEFLSQKNIFDVLVIGGGPSGSAASIYSSRKGINTGILTEKLGGQVLDTLSIENLVSTAYTEGPLLANTLKENVLSNSVDVIENQKASKIKKENNIFEVELESGVILKSKSLILSPGARWRKMNVIGEDKYRNKGVAYCPHCDGPLFKGKRVAVVGGGNSGVEAAIDLAGIVEHVTLIEFASTLRADQVLQKKLKSLSNVEIITDALTTEVKGDEQRLTSLVYQHRVSKEVKEIILSGVFVQIGLLPNTEWLDGFIALNERKEIIIDSYNNTNVDGVFAAGDATNVPYKQIVIAMGEGAKASLSSFDYLIRNS